MRRFPSPRRSPCDFSHLYTHIYRAHDLSFLCCSAARLAQRRGVRIKKAVQGAAEGVTGNFFGLPEPYIGISA